MDSRCKREKEIQQINPNKSQIQRDERSRRFISIPNITLDIETLD